MRKMELGRVDAEVLAVVPTTTTKTGNLKFIPATTVATNQHDLARLQSRSRGARVINEFRRRHWRDRWSRLTAPQNATATSARKRHSCQGGRSYWLLGSPCSALHEIIVMVSRAFLEFSCRRGCDEFHPHRSPASQPNTPDSLRVERSHRDRNGVVLNWL
jgi:hypothetical protein